MVARTDAQHRLRGIMSLCALLPGAAQSALPGLRVLHRLRDGSPDRCAASPPGNYATLR
ncbi:hypothetical protein AZ036_005522, partial [Klebsiella michiganensis]